MTKLLLIRHGETDDNRKGIFQGQAGGGLNLRGREQAGRLAARLAGAGLPIDGLYCSDLTRAVETAEIVGAALGRTPEQDPGLREVYLGAWQGLSGDEVSQQFPDEWAAWTGGVDVKRGGGESYAELTRRVRAAVARVAARHEAGIAVVISHGASIKTFAGAVLGVELLALRRLPGTGNTAVNLFSLGNGVDRLLVWNDTSHLHDPVVDALSRP